MANIKVIVNGKEYTEDQFKKDVSRMFDSVRDSKSGHMGSTDCDGVYCEDCPFHVGPLSCDYDSKVDSFKKIKIAYEWAQAHPILTNKIMLEKIFGDDVFNHICARVFEYEWFDKEYKEPKSHENE